MHEQKSIYFLNLIFLSKTSMKYVYRLQCPLHPPLFEPNFINFMSINAHKILKRKRMVW